MEDTIPEFDFRENQNALLIDDKSSAQFFLTMSMRVKRHLATLRWRNE